MTLQILIALFIVIMFLFCVFQIVYATANHERDYKLPTDSIGKWLDHQEQKLKRFCAALVESGDDYG